MAVSPAQVKQYLGGVDYPCRKEDLMNHAREMGADEEVMSTLESLPEQEYQSPADVTEAMAKMSMGDMGGEGGGQEEEM